MVTPVTGRPSKLTPELAELIAAEVADGMPIGLAAAAHGVSRDTVFAWQAQGRRDAKAGAESPHRDFSDRLERARATFAKALVAGIKAARHGTGERDWKALAYLERTRLPAHLSDRALEAEAASLEGDDAGGMPGWRPVEPVRCPACGAGTASDDGAPRFCGGCGAPLAPAPPPDSPPGA